MIDDSLNMKAQDFEAEQSPWFDIGKFRKWIQSRGVSITDGNKHNHTDGEVHYVLNYGSEVFDLHANYWDWRSGWQGAIYWVESITHNQPNTTDVKSS